MGQNSWQLIELFPTKIFDPSHWKAENSVNLFCSTFDGNNVLGKELNCIYTRHKLKWNWQTTIKQTAVGVNSNDMASKVMTWYRIVSKSKRLFGIAIRDRDDSGLIIDSLPFYNKRPKLAAEIPFSFLACSGWLCVGPSLNGNNFWRNLEGTRMRFWSAIICNYHSALANSQIPWRSTTVRYVVTNCKSFGKNLIHRRQRTWTIFSLL
jgi:hypothetical protein